MDGVLKLHNLVLKKNIFNQLGAKSDYNYCPAFLLTTHILA